MDDVSACMLLILEVLTAYHVAAVPPWEGDGKVRETGRLCSIPAESTSSPGTLNIALSNMLNSRDV